MRWEISSKLYSNFNYVRVRSFILSGAPIATIQNKTVNPDTDAINAGGLPS